MLGARNEGRVEYGRPTLQGRPPSTRLATRMGCWLGAMNECGDDAMVSDGSRLHPEMGDAGQHETELDRYEEGRRMEEADRKRGS